MAVSELPQGPFSYIGNIAFPDGSEPEAKLFDPGVLVDEDETHALHYIANKQGGKYQV